MRANQERISNYQLSDGFYIYFNRSDGLMILIKLSQILPTGDQSELILANLDVIQYLLLEKPSPMMINQRQ